MFKVRYQPFATYRPAKIKTVLILGGNLKVAGMTWGLIDTLQAMNIRGTGRPLINIIDVGPKTKKV